VTNIQQKGVFREEDEIRRDSPRNCTVHMKEYADFFNTVFSYFGRKCLYGSMIDPMD
jgi:hypothetical protein